MKLGALDVTLRIGSVEVTKVMLGDVQVYPTDTPATADVQFTVGGADFDFFIFESTGDITVDWGDGNIETVTGGSFVPASHTYGDSNQYQISITGVITQFVVNSADWNNNSDYLISFDKGSADIVGLNLQFNNNLTDIIFNELINCLQFQLNNNILPVSVINNGLIFCNNNGLLTGGWQSDNQTPAAAPTGAGATAAAALILSGWTVTTD